MATKRPPVSIISLLCLALSLVIFHYDSAHAEPPRATVIVIDPGHGGKNLGARGPAGNLEKDLALSLARQLNTEIGPNYGTLLTRSDDYDVETKKRSALANFHQAAVFISLHIGASFLRSPDGIAIYHYQPATTLSADTPVEDATPRLWHEQQLPHAAASRYLAEAMQRRFESAVGLGEAQVHGAPLVVLEGAAMPAIVIEIGNLTNPTAEKALASGDLLERYAKIIAEGLDAYLKSTK